MKKGWLVSLFKSLFFAGSLLLSSAAVQAQGLNLDVCPTCPYTTLQDAVAAVPEGLGETSLIRLSQRTYGGKTTVDTSKRIKIQGGWNADFSQRSADPSLTTLTQPVFGIITAQAGAGVNIELTLENLKIAGAGASNYEVGGAIAGSAFSGGVLTLNVERCLLTGNSASHGYGAAMGVLSYNPGSVVNLNLSSTSILSNAVTFYSGGGLYFQGSDSGTINGVLTNNIIAGNSAMYGGGIYAEASSNDAYGTPVLPGTIGLSLVNNTITGNTGWQYSYYGGGVGGGLLLNGLVGTLNFTSVNNIIFGNTATSTDASDLYLDRMPGGSLTVNISHTDIGYVFNEPTDPASYNEGTGMRNQSPFFVNASGGDYRLQANSPLIDAGTESGAPLFDFDGNPRPSGDGIDLGAFEFSSCAPPPAGLISRWTADGDAGDVWGLNNGVMMNGAGFAPGRTNYAFNFDGADDYMQVANPVGLPLGAAPRTVVLWFQTRRNLLTHTESALVQYGTPANGRMFGLITSANASGRLYFYGHDADLAGTTTLLADTWYQAAVTYDGTTLRLYLNGVEENSSPMSLDTALDQNGLTVGLRPNAIRWDGLIDELAVFDRALSALEILALYNAAGAGMCRQNIGIAAYHLPTNQFFSLGGGNLGQFGWGGADCLPLVWDYDGDGNPEISFYHIPTNQWFVRGYAGDPTGDGNLGQFGWGQTESIPVPGDYDGDGIAERAFYHSPTNRWFIEGQADPILFGWNGSECLPLPGDYDGDGITDLVLYHWPSNQWFRYGAGDLGQYGWGGADCLPVPADYDGDGIMDIAVYHVPTNQWFVKGYPSDNLGQYGWGGSKSFSIPVDYDGDGIAERGFYRWEENLWFLEGHPQFAWGWGGADFMPLTSQINVFNWFRFVLNRFN